MIEQSRKDIQALLDKQAADMAAGDGAAIMAAHAEDVVLFDMPPPLRIEASVKELQEWIDSWDQPPAVTYRDLEIAVSGGVAVAWGFVHTAVRRDGEDGGFWSRGSWAFRREAEVWKIAHHHNSVPFYMDGEFRAALDLEPGTGKAKIS